MLQKKIRMFYTACIFVLKTFFGEGLWTQHHLLRSDVVLKWENEGKLPRNHIKNHNNHNIWVSADKPRPFH